MVNLSPSALKWLPVLRLLAVTGPLAAAALAVEERLPAARRAGRSPGVRPGLRPCPHPAPSRAALPACPAVLSRVGPVRNRARRMQRQRRVSGANGRTECPEQPRSASPSHGDVSPPRLAALELQVCLSAQEHGGEGPNLRTAGHSQACSCCLRPRRPRALKPHPAVARARSTMLRCTASCDAQGVVRAEAWRRRRRTHLLRHLPCRHLPGPVRKRGAVAHAQEGGQQCVVAPLHQLRRRGRHCFPWPHSPESNLRHGGCLPMHRALVGAVCAPAPGAVRHGTQDLAGDG